MQIGMSQHRQHPIYTGFQHQTHQKTTSRSDVYNSMMRDQANKKSWDMSSTCCPPLRSHVLCCWVCRWVISTTSAVAPNACVSLASKTARGNHQGWMLALHGNALENQDALLWFVLLLTWCFAIANLWKLCSLKTIYTFIDLKKGGNLIIWSSRPLIGCLYSYIYLIWYNIYIYKPYLAFWEIFWDLSVSYSSFGFFVRLMWNWNCNGRFRC